MFIRLLIAAVLGVVTLAHAEAPHGCDAAINAMVNEHGHAGITFSDYFYFEDTDTELITLYWSDHAAAFLAGQNIKGCSVSTYKVTS